MPTPLDGSFRGFGGELKNKAPLVWQPEDESDELTISNIALASGGGKNGCTVQVQADGGPKLTVCKLYPLPGHEQHRVDLCYGPSHDKITVFVTGSGDPCVHLLGFTQVPLMADDSDGDSDDSDDAEAMAAAIAAASATKKRRSAPAAAAPAAKKLRAPPAAADSDDDSDDDASDDDASSDDSAASDVDSDTFEQLMFSKGKGGKTLLERRVEEESSDDEDDDEGDSEDDSDDEMALGKSGLGGKGLAFKKASSLAGGKLGAADAMSDSDDDSEDDLDLEDGDLDSLDGSEMSDDDEPVVPAKAKKAKPAAASAAAATPKAKAKPKVAPHSAASSVGSAAAASPGSQATGAGAFEDLLKAYLKKNGTSQLSKLGQDVKRPKSAPKLGAFLKSKPGVFAVAGNNVSLV